MFNHIIIMCVCVCKKTQYNAPGRLPEISAVAETRDKNNNRKRLEDGIRRESQPERMHWITLWTDDWNSSGLTRGSSTFENERKWVSTCITCNQAGCFFSIIIRILSATWPSQNVVLMS